VTAIVLVSLSSSPVVSAKHLRRNLSLLQCRDTDIFNAGYGDCDTYSKGDPNHQHCNSDKSISTMSDAVAFEACPQCGQCTVKNSRLPACKNTNEFDAGEGGCATYASTNYGFCETDHDSSSKIFGTLYAYEACPECGKCDVSLSPSGLEKCVKTSVFKSSHLGQGCSEYALGRPGHEYCRVDYDDSLYRIVYAHEACPECGECEGRLSSPAIGVSSGGGGGQARFNVDYETRQGECALSSGSGAVAGVNGVDYTRHYGQGLAWCKNLCNRELSHCKAFQYSAALRKCDIWNTLPTDTSYSSMASCHMKKHFMPPTPRKPERLLPGDCTNEKGYVFKASTSGNAYTCDDVGPCYKDDEKYDGKCSKKQHLCRRKDSRTGKFLWQHCKKSCRSLFLELDRNPQDICPRPK